MLITVFITFCINILKVFINSFTYMLTDNTDTNYYFNSSSTQINLHFKSKIQLASLKNLVIAK